MKQTAALFLVSLAHSVYGHGYLTIPNSRTRLGFEVPQPPLSTRPSPS